MTPPIATPKGVSADGPADVDRRAMSPVWYRNQEWRDELHRRLTHKALDIPEGEEMNVDNSRHGLGTLGTMGVAAVAGLPGLAAAGILGLSMLGQPAAQPPAPAPQPLPISQPADSEYEVRFYNSKGELIEVPRLPKPTAPKT